ncbi:MAG TPA: hypothetical protein PLH14_07505 [Sphaerochaeta sp.]|nr:hypothetical protein [Sphaerochaeta sp.]HQB91229.1 hypothetical protein [Sphaerochaeta sp.]
MKRPIPSFLLIILILVALPFGVWGTVTAVYTPEPQIAFEIAPYPFTSNTVLAAKLGRITMTSTTGVIYTPSFVQISSASGAVSVRGLMKGDAGGDFVQGSQDFYTYSVAYPNGLGAEPVLQVLYGNVWPIIQNDSCAITTLPFYVDIFLVNMNIVDRHAAVGYRPASYFKENSPYTLPSNFNPTFVVAAAARSGVSVGWYAGAGTITDPNLGAYVTTEAPGGTGTTTPVIGPRAYTSDPNNPNSPGLIYGDPPTQPTTPTYEVFFEASQADFTISDAYTGKVRINTAKIKVLDGVEGQTYARDIIFTDSGTTNSFQLKSSEGASTISYDLYFETANKKVNYGERISWSDLVPFPLINERGLWIGGIKKNEVDQRLSGSYSDTIYVNIVSPL